MTAQEWRERFKNVYDLCISECVPEMRVNFTVAELRDLTMKMIKLKHYEEQFEKDKEIEC